MGDVGRAVITHYGLKSRHARHNILRPAAKTGEEVRLDESGRNPNLSLSKMAVDQGRSSVTRGPERDERRRILRLMIENTIILQHGRGEHSLQLEASVWAVRAELVEQGDLFARHIG